MLGTLCALWMSVNPEQASSTASRREELSGTTWHRVRSPGPNSVGRDSGVLIVAGREWLSSAARFYSRKGEDCFGESDGFVGCVVLKASVWLHPRTLCCVGSKGGGGG